VGYKFFRDIDIVTYIKLFFVNLLFLTDILNLPTGQQNAWTLTYEWLFYFWFAAVFYFYTKRNDRTLPCALAMFGIIAIIYFPIAAYFLVGAAIRFLRPSVPLRGWLGVSIALLCGAAMYVSLEYINSFLGLIPGFILFAMVATPDSGIASLLSKPVPQFVGKISYSLYLVHPFALFPLQQAGAKLASHEYSLWLLWVCFVAIGTLASFTAATLTYELLEVRLRRYLTGLFTKDRPEHMRGSITANPAIRPEK
jgi:peptidoglycan/LPS O-acetylase OafA/YrhL